MGALLIGTVATGQLILFPAACLVRRTLGALGDAALGALVDVRVQIDLHVGIGIRLGYQYAMWSNAAGSGEDLSLGGFMAMFALNLADFADARRRLVENPALIPDAIEESLRFNTSGQRFRRCLTRDLELHGQKMHQGDFVCLAYGSANRDERQFPNPDVYDIARKPRSHLGFGGGVHSCLGAMIARVATTITFEELLKRFPRFERVRETLNWIPSSTFRSPLKLELAVN